MRASDPTSAPVSPPVQSAPSATSSAQPAPPPVHVHEGKRPARPPRNNDGFELSAPRPPRRHQKSPRTRAPSEAGPSLARKADDFGISESGQQQMKVLSDLAGSHSAGRHPDGKCYKHVKNFLDRATYGRLGGGTAPYLGEAHMVASWLNQGNRYDSLGLKKLPITNPYEAPEGSLIVVRAGTPGTRHPTAGDIVVKGPGDHFYNGGEMGYHGPQNFPPGNDYVLGIYAPK